MFTTGRAAHVALGITIHDSADGSLPSCSCCGDACGSCDACGSHVCHSTAKKHESRRAAGIQFCCDESANADAGVENWLLPLRVMGWRPRRLNDDTALPWSLHAASRPVWCTDSIESLTRAKRVGEGQASGNERCDRNLYYTHVEMRRVFNSNARTLALRGTATALLIDALRTRALGAVSSSGRP